MFRTHFASYGSRVLACVLIVQGFAGQPFPNGLLDQAPGNRGEVMVTA
jgi:hypothetical protein